LLLEVNTQISDDGSLIYEVFEALPALNVLPAQLYSNNNGVKTLLQSVPADPTFSGTGFGEIDAGAASPDFSLVSLLDDDGGSDLRVRVFSTSDFTTPVISTEFSDFGGGGSANGGFFSASNNYLFINYISSATGIGPIFKVLSVQSGLSTVATASLPGFSESVRPISIGSKTFIPANYLGATGFTDPVIQPPYGFQIAIYDESNNSLAIVSSPTMYNAPEIDVVLLSNGKIRIAAGIKNIVGFADSPITAPYPAVPLLLIGSATYTDTNNVQIFDFDPNTNALTQVYHITVSGDINTLNWLPSSNGTVLALVHTLVGQFGTPDLYTANNASDALDWLILDTDLNGVITGSREVGPLQVLPPAIIYSQISRDSKWLVCGPIVSTPLGFADIPSFGQNTIDPTSPIPNGFNDSFLYSIQPTTVQTV
jgi:hypothetical protein